MHTTRRHSQRPERSRASHRSPLDSRFGLDPRIVVVKAMQKYEASLPSSSAAADGKNDATTKIQAPSTNGRRRLLLDLVILLSRYHVFHRAQFSWGWRALGAPSIP